jgi:hypothetical protein
MGVLVRVLPYMLLSVLLTVSLAYKNIRGALSHYHSTRELVATNAATIRLFMVDTILICVGYVVARIIGQW